MYSWGPDTTDWKKPGAYKYDSARSPYLDSLASAAKKAGPRTYVAGSEPDMALVNPRNKTIATDSKNPLVLAVDVTGSMSTWPREIFDRLPLLYQTLSQYRPDLEISFGAIGDAYTDRYPLQVNDFAKGLDLEKKLKALYPEGGGGGQISESYELFGHYIDQNCKTPKATNPFLIIFGDEKSYEHIEPGQVKHYIGSVLKDPLEAKKVWESLKQKFNVFYLQKPYGNGGEGSVTKEVKAHWQGLLGDQRVIALPSMERAVDVAMGLIAKSWGEYPDFTDSLLARHDKSEAASVNYSLRHIPTDPVKHSVLSKKAGSVRTKSLIDPAK